MESAFFIKEVAISLFMLVFIKLYHAIQHISLEICLFIQLQFVMAYSRSLLVPFDLFLFSLHQDLNSYKISFIFATPFSPISSAAAHASSTIHLKVIQASF